jgi:hypothetical protein
MSLSSLAREDRRDAERIEAGLRTFFRIADAWELSPDEAMVLLGSPPRSTFYKWRSGDVGRVPPDTLERLSHLFGVYGALHSIFSAPERADGWVRRPNQAAAFGGRSALDRMLDGRVADLWEVRRHLEGLTAL